jgi:hypothetical protein
MLTIAVEDEATIHLLNTHSEIIASKFQVSPKYNEYFKSFLKAIEEANFPDGYLKDPKHPCSRAYYTYFAYYRQGITETDGKEPEGIPAAPTN